MNADVPKACRTSPQAWAKRAWTAIASLALSSIVLWLAWPGGVIGAPALPFIGGMAEQGQWGRITVYVVLSSGGSAAILAIALVLRTCRSRLGGALAAATVVCLAVVQSMSYGRPWDMWGAFGPQPVALLGMLIHQWLQFAQGLLAVSLLCLAVRGDRVGDASDHDARDRL